MRTLRMIIGCGAALLALASCGKEATEALTAPEKNLVPVTLRAAVTATRTDIDGKTPVWVKGDKIGVFTEDQEFCPAFTARDGGSGTTAFSGMKPEYSTLYRAFYPYDATAEYEDGALYLTLPQTQSGKASEAIMVGSSEDGEEFQFENICCVIRMTIPASLGATRVELVRNDQVTGPFRVETELLPYGIIGESDGSSYLDRRATLSSSGTISGEQYLSVLPSSSKRLEMALTNASGKVGFIATDFSSGKAYIEGRLKNLGTLPSNLTFHDAALIADPSSQQL